uniref:Uncharacterized protein n=1 Tax=Oryza glumipatula TaxID=40148 RepID=A0A0E0B074_9ORYZ
MEVEGIVKLRPLYASRRGVPGAALLPWVWVLPGFTTNERKGRRGAGFPAAERRRRRRLVVFPGVAHLGRALAGQGGERRGRNGEHKGLVRPIKRGDGGYLFWTGKGRRSEEMDSPRRGKADGARIWPAMLR